MALKLPERWRTGIETIAETPKRVEIIAVVTVLVLILCVTTLIVVTTKAGKS